MKIICGDCATEMSKMEEGSIHLVVTSPPYDNLRTYNGFSWNFEATAKQIYRVLCDGGIVCWNVGDSVVDGSETLNSFRQALFFKEQCGFRVHDTMIWEKANFSNPSSNRYHQVWEPVFIFSKGRPRIFNPICDLVNKFGTCLGKNSARLANGEMIDRAKNQARELGMRRNVWRGNTSGQEDMCQQREHPATMPRWLAHDLILSWSNSGDTVLDPFAGSGTTGVEAIQLGREAIMIEISPDYCKLIEQNCNVTPSFAM